MTKLNETTRKSYKAETDSIGRKIGKRANQFKHVKADIVNQRKAAVAVMGLIEGDAVRDDKDALADRVARSNSVVLSEDGKSAVGSNGETYRFGKAKGVITGRPHLYCTCPDFRYRESKKSNGLCKHLIAAIVRGKINPFVG